MSPCPFVSASSRLHSKEVVSVTARMDTIITFLSDVDATQQLINTHEALVRGGLGCAALRAVR
jgi:hypothetical protein